MSADIGRSFPARFKGLNQLLALEHPVNRRKRGEKAAGLVAMDKDVAYRLAQKGRQPGGIFNGLAFVIEQLVPSRSRFGRFGIGPAAKLSGSNSKQFAGVFLADALGQGLPDNTDHGLPDLRFEISGERAFEA